MSKNLRVTVLPDSDYGLVTAVQTVDRSTAGSNAGSNIGAGVAQIAYVDRSFRNGNYSPWAQLGMGLLGAMAGSAVNIAPVQQYQHFYTVRRSDGEMQRIEIMSDSPAQITPGSCINVITISPVAQRLCEETSDDIEAGFFKN